MKRISRFLLIALALCGTTAFAATVVPGTVGSNLTAFNNNSGAVNNAMWNNYTNPRASGAASTTAPTADFGNCNALILRCAQPKCANGGCSTMDIARPIVSGCVQSNPTCTQYGDDLIEFISAQLVSDANAAAQSAAANAQIAAAQAAAQQSSQQMAQMQQQMVQMQQQMQQQSADTAAQIQAALAQQQAATAQAIADAANTNAAAINSATTQMQNAAAAANTATVSNDSNLTAAQQTAAAAGVSADVLAREQISGQILSKIENAEDALKRAQAAMKTAFEYAGCDSTGSNCTGPKRVSTFKDKAMEFFDPYNDVLDELYDGLILAQSVGVDITDIYMMLNGTCNVWGQYLCAPGQVMHYNSQNCVDGRSVPVRDGGATVRGGADCEIGQVVPMSDGGCQLIKMLTSDEEVQRNWLYPETGYGGVQVRVGCASEALDNSTLFRNRRRQADIDIEVLQRMIEQDAPAVFGGNRFGQNKSADPDGLKYCAITTDTYQDLQTYASLKQLPDTVCVPDDDLLDIYNNGGRVAQGDSGADNQSVFSKCGSLRGYDYEKCLCENSVSNNAQWVVDNGDNAITGQGTCKCIGNSAYQFWDADNALCVNANGNSAADIEYFAYEDAGGYRRDYCNDYGGKWNSSSLTCDCSAIQETTKRTACEIMTAKNSSASTDLTLNTGSTLNTDYRYKNFTLPTL